MESARVHRLWAWPWLLGLGCAAQSAPTQGELLQSVACVDNIQKGDYDAAESRCELCLEYNDNSPECLNGLGLIWYARGVDDKAREYFKKAVRQNNDFAQGRSNLGVLEFKEGRFENAVSYFEAAIEIDPRYLDARYNMALAYLRIGDRRKAQAYTKEAERARRANRVVQEDKLWLNIDDADRKFVLDYYERAERQYRKIFELYPEHIDSYRDMGVIMTFRAQIETVQNRRVQWIQDAETYFKQCINLEPLHEECHGNLAHLLLAVGRGDEALFHYVQCLAANRRNPICGTEIKMAYEASQMQSESLKRYVAQLAENPGYAPGHLGFCTALFDKGLSSLAVAECQNALKLDPALCPAHYQLALHYKEELDRDAAIESCRGMIQCAGGRRYEREVEECKEIVRALEAE